MDERTPTFDQILTLYAKELIGFSEARSLLAEVFPSFKKVRDWDLDREVEGDESDQEEGDERV